MRTWTLAVSIVFHLCVITGVVVAPLFATGDLPAPRRAAPEYVLVTAHVPDVPPVRRRESPPQTTVPFPDTAPERITRDTIEAEPQRPDAVDFSIADSGGGRAELLPSGVAAAPPDNDVIEPPLPQPKEPLRVGGAVRAPQKIRDAAPRYPAIAQSAGVQGIVILETIVDEGGAVRDVRVLRSQPLLDAAAIEAVRQWRFTPTLLNGQPIPIVMTVTVSFTLNR